MIKDKLIDKVMFQRLKPLAVMKYWNLIQQNILEALGGHVVRSGAEQRLMAEVSSGGIQVWTVLSVDEQPKLLAMVFTKEFVDPLLGTKGLLIYGLTVKAQATKGVWTKCLEQISLYAKERGCYAVHAQTKWDGVRKMLDAAGFDMTHTVHVKEV